MYRHNYIVSGGTFDHFHIGHKAFLREQLLVSKKILIGVTSDTYVQQYKEKNIESYETRVHALKEFLLSEGALERVEIQCIDDAGIPKIWEKYPIEAIAVTEDTQNGAQRINEERKAKGTLLLKVYVIGHIQAQDGNRITSSRIRAGEIDKEGISYVTTKWLTEMLLLPQELRKEISKPFGKLFKSIDEFLAMNKIDSGEMISVGDVITKTFEEKKIVPKVRIVDLFVQRKRKYSSLEAYTVLGNEVVRTVRNPAGTITPSLWKGVQESIFGRKNSLIFIEGEEDLAVLPCVLVSPLGFQILYGQPEKGIIAVLVTEKTKKRARELVGKFTISASKI